MKILNREDVQLVGGWVLLAAGTGAALVLAGGVFTLISVARLVETRGRRALRRV